MQKKIFSCQAYLSNGEIIDITYESEYLRQGTWINEIILCNYRGVDISPIFLDHKKTKVKAADLPNEIYCAVENNARYQWERKDSILNALGLKQFIN